MKTKNVVLTTISTLLLGAAISSIVATKYFGLDYKVKDIYSNKNNSGTIMVMPKKDGIIVDGFGHGIPDNVFDKVILGNPILNMFMDKKKSSDLSQGSIYLMSDLTNILNDYLISIKKELVANQTYEYVDKVTKNSKYNKLLKKFTKKVTRTAKKITHTPSINIYRSNNYEFYQVYVNNKPIVIGKNSIEAADTYYITSKDRKTKLGKLVFDLYNTLENFKDTDGKSYVKPININHIMSDEVMKML